MLSIKTFLAVIKMLWQYGCKRVPEKPVCVFGLSKHFINKIHSYSVNAIYRLYIGISNRI